MTDLGRSAINVHLVASRETLAREVKHIEPPPPLTELVTLCCTLSMDNLFATTPITLSNISPLT